MKIRYPRVHAWHFVVAAGLALGAVPLIGGCGGGDGTFFEPNNGNGQNEIIDVSVSSASGGSISTLEVNSTMVLHGVAVDAIHQPVPGARVNWSVVDGQILEGKTLDNGDFQVTGKQVGDGSIIASSGSVKNTITITVTPAGGTTTTATTTTTTTTAGTTTATTTTTTTGTATAGTTTTETGTGTMPPPPPLITTTGGTTGGTTTATTTATTTGGATTGPQAASRSRKR